VDCSLLGCEALQSCKWLPTFRRNVPPPSSGPEPHTRLHGVTTQDTAIDFFFLLSCFWSFSFSSCVISFVFHSFFRLSVLPSFIPSIFLFLIHSFCLPLLLSLILSSSVTCYCTSMDLLLSFISSLLSKV
jgi:hypothetical protein